MAHELPELPRPFVPGDECNPRDFYVADQMRAYATAHAASLEAEVERLRVALYLALPYVEDCVGEPYYKPGSVLKFVKELRAILG